MTQQAATDAPEQISRRIRDLGDWRAHPEATPLAPSNGPLPRPVR